jgi:hypothetical protein
MGAEVFVKGGEGGRKKRDEVLPPEHTSKTYY